MGRPTTKPDLIEAANGQFEKLWKMIDSMPEEAQNAPFCFEDRDKNVRDVLVHIYEWHQLLLNWVGLNQKGKEMPFLPAPYNWRTYPKMNVEFWEKHQSTSYCDAREMFTESHEAVMELICAFSNDELFSKKYFPWAGTSTVGSYCVSATASHYDWAMKKIKKHMKSLESENR